MLMSEKEVKKNTPTFKEIQLAAFNKALECYGVKGFVRFNANVTGNYELIGEEKVYRGVLVRKNAKGLFVVDLYVVLAVGVKITETLFECQKVVRYALNKKFSNLIAQVNVFAMDVI